jgi:hypothetical protein
MKYFILLSSIILLFPSTGWSAFTVVNDEVFVNVNTGTTTFTIEFNQAPDFFTVDEYNRQANGFQYYIYGNESLGYPDYYSSIIRGEEIHLTGDVLRIREATPPSNDLESGGWGYVIYEAPLALNGSTISFTVNTSLLTSFLTKDGVFKYDLMATEFGGQTYWISGKLASLLRPTIKEHCEKDGWENFGFKNRGECVRFVKKHCKP